MIKIHGLILTSLILLTGCVGIKPVDPMVYTVKQPDGGYLLRQEEYDAAVAKVNAERGKHMWNCTAFDWGTTGVGLAIGLAEANPLGILIVPLAFIFNHKAREKAEQGDASLVTAVTVSHCAAGGLNIITIAGAL